MYIYYKIVKKQTYVFNFFIKDLTKVLLYGNI